MHQRIIFALSALLLLGGCQTSSPDRNTPKTYFDLEQLLRNAQAQLTTQNPVITKTIIRDAQTETQRLNIPNWEHELEVFRAADINKPVWRDSYQTSQQGDTLTYTAKAAEELPVRQLRILQNKDSLYIWASYQQTTPFFDTQRQLMMRFALPHQLAFYQADIQQGNIGQANSSLKIVAQINSQ